MPLPTNLFEYYQGIGQALPSLEERGKLFEQQGLGSANLYAGSVEQNTALLQKLLSAQNTNQAPSPAAVAQPIVTSQVTQPVQQPAATPATQQPTQPQPTAPPTTPNYTGPSIVDYLQSINQPSDFASRANLATQKGISNYQGTAEQNTQLLNVLRGAVSPPTETAPTTEMAPTLVVGTPKESPSAPITTLQPDIQTEIGLPKDITNTSIEDVLTKVSKFFGFDEITKQTKELDDKFIDDSAKVNDNPWLTEGIRRAEIDKLRTKYEARKDALVNRLRLQQDVVGKALEFYYKERDFKKDILMKQLDLKAAGFKDQQATVNNLIQTYPDAGILPSDTLAIASGKAANAPTFHAKNTLIRAVVDPVNGGITYYDSRGNYVYHVGAGGAGNIPIGSPKSPPVPIIPKVIQASIGEVAGFKYIDAGKLNPGQIPLAQRTSVDQNIPLLSKADVDAMQQAQATYNSASALLKTISSKAQKLIYATNPIEVVGQALNLESGAITRSNTDAYVFKNTVKAFSSLLTRAAGEKGVLTNMDVQRIINALPNFTDTIQSAQGKISSLDSIFASQVNGAVSAYLGKSNTTQEETRIFNGAPYKKVNGGWQRIK